MSSDHLDEKIPLFDLPNYLPKRMGKKLHRTTVWRWSKIGKNGVKLRVHWDVSNGIYTTLRDFALFEKQVAKAQGVQHIVRRHQPTSERTVDGALKAGGW